MAAHTERAAPTFDVSDGGLKLVLRAIQVGPLLILMLLCALLTLLTPFFLTGDNLTNLLVQIAPLAALAIGQLFVTLRRPAQAWHAGDRHDDRRRRRRGHLSSMAAVRPGRYYPP